MKVGLQEGYEMLPKLLNVYGLGGEFRVLERWVSLQSVRDRGA